MDSAGHLSDNGSAGGGGLGRLRRPPRARRKMRQWRVSRRLSLIEEEGGTSRVELDVQDHHRGGGSSRTTVNGGIVSYMFDGLLGATVASTWDEDVLGQ